MSFNRTTPEGRGNLCGYFYTDDNFRGTPFPIYDSNTRFDLRTIGFDNESNRLLTSQFNDKLSSFRWAENSRCPGIYIQDRGSDFSIRNASHARKFIPRGNNVPKFSSIPVNPNNNFNDKITVIGEYNSCAAADPSTNFKQSPTQALRLLTRQVEAESSGDFVCDSRATNIASAAELGCDILRFVGSGACALGGLFVCSQISVAAGGPEISGSQLESPNSVIRLLDRITSLSISHTKRAQIMGCITAATASSGALFVNGYCGRMANDVSAARRRACR